MTAESNSLKSSPDSVATAAPVNIPHLIRELRNRTGLTQEKFAARLGVTFPTINRWENGRAKPSPLALRQIQSLVQEIAPTPSPSMPRPAGGLA